jgi:magnesium transporter
MLGIFMSSVDLGQVADNVESLVRQDRVEEAISLLKSLPPHEVVSVLLRLKADVRAKVLVSIDLERISEELAKLPPEIIAEIISLRGLDDVAKVLVKLPVDEVADFISKAPSKVRVELLRLLPRDFAHTVASLMKFPGESVGSVMTTMVPVFPANMTVGEVLEAYIQKSKLGLYEPHYYIYIVNEEGVLLGYTDVKTLLIKPRDMAISSCIIPIKATIHPFADREEAAKLAIQYDLLEVPVVDFDGRFMGVVTLDDLLDVISSEYTEDLLKYAGVVEAIKGSYVIEKPSKLALRRLPAIVLLYIANAITGSIVASFEKVIESLAILAAFMPMLADNSGNIGSQSSAIILRALVTGELKLNKRDILTILVKEFLTTTLMVAILAPIAFTLGFAITYIALREIALALKVAIVVSVALTTSCYVADVVGAFLPVILAKLRVDPATASAPIITTIADISTVLVYFTVATILLHL